MHLIFRTALMLCTMLVFVAQALAADVRSYAVLPFKVNGSSGFTYLEKAIPSMLNSRLYWQGHFQPVADAALAKAGAVSDAGSAAKALSATGADYVIWGDVTVMGDNASLVTTLAKDRGRMKILGLAISNALVALAGCIVCHENRSFSATMGTGQLVYGLAAVIIGISLAHAWSGSMERLTSCRKGILRVLTHPAGTTAVIVGSILYKTCIQAAMSMGVPANMMKLVTALLFLLVLVLSGRKGEEIIRA